MKLFRITSDAFFVIAATFLITLSVAAMATRAWGWNSESVAAWVQAVGSVVAIVGAYIVGERQAKATLRAAQDAHNLAEEKRQKSILSVIQAAKFRLDEIRKGLEESDLNIHDVYHDSIIDSFVDIMSKLPVSELGSDKAINSFILLIGQFPFLKKSIKSYIDGPYKDPETIEEIKKLKKQDCDRKEIDRMVENARAVLKRNVKVHLDFAESNFKDFFAAVEMIR
ncbi:hypothetical protein [Paraburkholderia bonniea]|uniref:hypothetical protein n=1 Tax=Paraburkholderia bonniea TaxID=2152891 RepID=UPI0012924C38|nr:hypothetical protein [Paraburkholderia bonniea]